VFYLGSVGCVAFDHAGKYLVSSSSDLTVKLWELGEYQCAKTFYGHNHSVSWATFVLDDECILSCSRDKTIKLWEIATGFCRRTFVGHDDWVRQVISTTDSKTLASCSSDQTVLLWTIDKETPLLTMQGHDNVVESILFVEHESAQFLAGSELLRARFKPQATLESLKQAEESKNGTSTPQLQTQRLFLLSASRDKTIRLFNCSNGEQLHIFVGHDTWVRSLALHPTGKYLYSASDDKSIRVWDLNFGKEKRKLDAHEHFVSTVRFNPKYAVLASTGHDMTIKIWALK
jgi:platelet-activating factor acetylhydrolase IB subunit alpha